MSEQWYWQHGRELRGPLDTGSLERLIAQHRLGDHDQVRLAGDETWLSGTKVKELFGGGGRPASSSEAAARLLSQARKLQAPTDQPSRCALRQTFIANVRRVIQQSGGPLERVAEAIEAAAKLGLQRTKLLLGLAAFVLVLYAVMNLRFDSHARYRQVHAQLAQTWQDLDRLQAAQPTAGELRRFADARLPGLQLALTSLIQDSQQAPGRSADSFARFYSNERNWNAAHSRNALVQATLALQSILQQLPGAEPSIARSAVFQQHLTIASERLTPGAQLSAEFPSPAGRHDDRRHRTILLIAGVLTVDAVLIVIGVTYWRRSRR